MIKLSLLLKGFYSILLTAIIFVLYIKQKTKFFWVVNYTIIIVVVTCNINSHYNTPCFAGYGPLPTAVKGEVFPPNVKGISSAVTVGYSWGLSFVITKLFPHINEVIKNYQKYI